MRRFGLSFDPRQLQPLEAPRAFTKTAVPEPMIDGRGRPLSDPTALLTAGGGGSWMDHRTFGVSNRLLSYAAGGVLALGAVVLIFNRKSTSVAGYRRRRSRR